MNYSQPISDTSDFEAKLHSQFHGRLRLRWSLERGEWHVEQQVKRGLFSGQRPTKQGWDETHDRYVQNRDGTILIMSVRTGDRMPCPRCGSDLKVPFYDTHLITCQLCTLRGKAKHVAAVYMPLGDTLINYLKSIDPENPISESLAEGIDRQNMALEASMERDALRESEAAFHLNYNRVVGIPQWGYAGTKRFAGSTP